MNSTAISKAIRGVVMPHRKSGYSHVPNLDRYSCDVCSILMDQTDTDAVEGDSGHD